LLKSSENSHKQIIQIIPSLRNLRHSNPRSRSFAEISSITSTISYRFIPIIFSDGHSMTLKLRVLYPNQAIESVEVHGSDTPRAVAQCGPPLKHPVVLLHNGHCLCPYLSLDFQGVTTGDLIVLHSIPAPSTRKPVTEERDSSTGIFIEMLRLADVALVPYEVSLFGDLVYQQMWAEQQEEASARDPPRRQSQTVVAERPRSVSVESLPSLWPMERH
jgi:hypothetical protein